MTAATAAKPYTKKLSAYTSIFCIFLVICVMIGVVSLRFYQQLDSTLKAESKSYLQEVARRVASNIDRIIADNYAVLYTMAASLTEAGDATTMAEVQQRLKKQSAYWSYENIMLVDATGRAYTLDNKELFLSLEDIVHKELQSGKQSMSTTQVINNREYVLFLVPLQGVTIEGHEMVALAGGYAPSSFGQVLSMKSFNDRAYSQIISKSGAVIIRPSSPLDDNWGYNIFATLQGVDIDNGYRLEQIRSDIVANRSDQVSLTKDGEQLYMVYTPTQPDDWYLITFVPAEVVNEKSSALLVSNIVISGMITLAFAALTLTLALVFNSHRRKLEQLAYVDEVTGGHTIQRFFDIAGSLRVALPDKQYAIMYTNIENFKVLNEQIGRQSCDVILRYFYQYLAADMGPCECIARQSADNFCLMVEYTSDDEMVERLTRWLHGSDRLITSDDMPCSLPITEYGIYVIEDSSLSFPQMIDRAKLALKEATWNIENKVHYAFYNDAMRRELMREKQLEDRMEAALKNNEFQVYLQPKYRLPDEFINGAEALVRWQTNDEGMIFPDEFIPLFEKNGFIIQIDLFVFEQVCITLQSWLDRGLEPLRVSVNCSRIHLRNPKFLAPYIQIADRHGINKGLIEIELTESIVLENSDRLIEIIEDIKGAGFGCSMDDFGSGYSSLNLLQTIPVDTLKLDRIFFRVHPSGAQRTEAVVRSVITMARALSMETVAEGVEHRAQVDMLKRAGCDYIQGYVYAKPMPIDDFEKRAFGI